MILAATGHRPDKLGGYNIETEAGLTMLALKHIELLQPDEVISGMALGWDTAVAEASILFDVPLIAAVPFKGQEASWPPARQAVYRAILEKAARVEIITAGDYSPWKMALRNKWMVNRADHMLALWDGSGTGGTANCIKEANKRGVPVTNVWDEWSSR